jgi:transcriptional regulator with GAF, ATPase, and Fis domain
VDVRIIAATNKQLEELVKSGRFREDLYFRLNVIPIRIPPLRERREDIMPLAEYYLAEFSREFKRAAQGFPEGVRAWMVSHEWPGNVRELKNVIERSIILGSDTSEGEVDPHLPGEEVLAIASYGLESSEDQERFDDHERDSVRISPASEGESSFRLPETGVNLEEVERGFIRQSLEMTQGNQTRAAKMLGLTRDALRYRMRKFGYL